jgi:photosynthetic reaction center cytochrome c subunit
MRKLIPLLLFCLIPFLAVSQDAPKQGGGGGRGPKNLKVLKPDTNIRSTMMGFTVALGVKCDHCHIQGNFASDENPKKDTGRNMIVMVNEINAKFPDGKEHVSCFTCHRGEVTPKMAAAPAAPPPAQ